MSRKEKRRKMLFITRQWEQNGISQKTFSQANGIKLYTLRYWISKNQQQQNFSSGFIQLNERQQQCQRLLKVYLQVIWVFAMVLPKRQQGKKFSIIIRVFAIVQ